MEIKDGTARKLYIDSALVINTTDVFTDEGYWIIGSRDDLAQPYKGLIDEVGIWSRVLSPSEISELWNSGSGKELF